MLQDEIFMGIIWVKDTYYLGEIKEKGNRLARFGPAAFWGAWRTSNSLISLKKTKTARSRRKKIGNRFAPPLFTKWPDVLALCHSEHLH